ncbi:MAG: hypothetical protein GY750_06995 [Lentisphaerae bacterium]|nr:hypothetical protein [Lentisphaerota bacterium]MCP4101157.1 hypothetical protein [Lentisphaerota bacterium]
MPPGVTDAAGPCFGLLPELRPVLINIKAFIRHNLPGAAALYAAVSFNTEINIILMNYSHLPCSLVVLFPCYRKRQPQAWLLESFKLFGLRF